VLMAVYVLYWQKGPDSFEPIDFAERQPGPLDHYEYMNLFGSESRVFGSIVSDRREGNYLNFDIMTERGQFPGITMRVDYPVPLDASVKIRWRGTGLGQGMLVDVIDEKEEFFQFHADPPRPVWDDTIIPLHNFSTNIYYQRPHVKPTGKMENQNIRGLQLTFFPLQNATVDIKQIEFLWRSDRWEVWTVVICTLLFGFLLLGRTTTGHIFAGGEWNFRSNPVIARGVYIFFAASVLIASAGHDPRVISTEFLVLYLLIFVLMIIDELGGKRKSKVILWAWRYMVVLILGWYIGIGDNLTLLATLLVIGIIPMLQVRSTAVSLALPATAVIVLVIYPKGELVTILPPAMAVIGTSAIIGLLVRQLILNSEIHRENRHELTLYEQSLKRSSEAIVTVGPNGIIRWINTGFEKVSGYSSNEVCGKSIFDLVYHEDRRSIEESITEEKIRAYLDVRISTKEGGVRFLLARIFPITRSNQLHGYQIIGTDLTEKRSLENQLNQIQRIESLGALAGGVAHDFNNILASILGYSSYLKMKISDGHDYYKPLERIEQGASRAASLTAKLLAFARGGGYEKKPLDMNALVEETAEILRDTIDKSLTIQTRLAPDIPSMEGDVGQLQQVIINVCLNSRDAMPEGGTISIETKTEVIDEIFIRKHVGTNEGLHIVVAVVDTGVGMDEQTQKRMFEPFFTTKAKDKGTGLGLSMVHGIVSSHGGFILVDSAPGKGSTFSIYLPASEKSLPPREVQQYSTVNGTGKVLVVDDEDYIRDLVRDILESTGYTVATAVNGEEAISIYQNEGDTIDLVILDMVMPKMDGKAVFCKLREMDPAVKVILSSGYSARDSAQDIINEGIAGIIQKPYKSHELQRTVESILVDRKVR
jgi:PAS domain S-box-containing protein